MQKTRFLQRLVWWGGGAVLLALVFWGMVRLSGNVQLPAQSGALAVAVHAQDNVQGPASASVTLVEYSDFQCPACAAFNPIVKQLFSDADLLGKIRLVYRYFPLSEIHANAQLSARVAQAAALQGKFWQMHDLLFTNQSAWENQSDAAARATFTGYARQLGLDMTKFSADLDSAAVVARVQADYDGGVNSGVDSTPSFFVNGTLMPHPSSYSELKQYLLDATHANQ
jgi:protein-disulfide isomerase